jgi:hypothetical protein
MHRAERLTSITSAKLALVPTAARAQLLSDALFEPNPGSAFQLRRSGGRPDIDRASLVVALAVKTPRSNYRLGGLVAAFEVGGHDSSLSQPAPPPSYLINGLYVGSLLLGWQPSMRALLLASLMVVIATANCDGAASPGRKVVCRIDSHDGLAKQALHDLSAIRCETIPSFVRRQIALAGDPGPSALYAFDDKTLMTAASMIAKLLDSEDRPRRSFDAEGDVIRTFDEALAIEFGRPFSHLKPEIELLASGSLELGWALPATNDQSPGRYESSTVYAAGK